MKIFGISLFLLATVLPLSQAMAEEQTLKFRLITRSVNSTNLETPVEGRSLSLSQAAGVAVFEDGRLADKQFVVHTDNAGADGSYAGYSTYTFQNGDSLTLSFTGGWGAGGNGGGDYTVVSGTGAYEGATGTGRFDPVKNPWENANLFDGVFNLTVGGN